MWLSAARCRPAASDACEGFRGEQRRVDERGERMRERKSNKPVPNDAFRRRLLQNKVHVPCPSALRLAHQLAGALLVAAAATVRRARSVGHTNSPMH